MSHEFLKGVKIEQGPFSPTWESLRTYQCPDWFRDAKLGIWAHWGPQCVPMYGDWYARHMYCEGHAQYLHHWRKWGHPSKHGFKDVAALWKAEKWDPEALMDLYKAAGAKYFVAQAVHHDNFDNWNSAHNPFNATKVGPMKDIVGLWQKAAKRRGMKFGASEHLGASFSWWSSNKGADKAGPYARVPYDGSDANLRHIYHANEKANKYDPKNPWAINPWYTEDECWHETWFRRIKDLVDNYELDLLYSDGPLPWDVVGLNIVAHLYNLSIKRNGANQAVYNQKSTDPKIFSIGVLDIERGNVNEPAAYPWQNDTCVGGWFYDVRQVYKTGRQVIEILVDGISKNGNLLLNLTQKPDGSFDDECLYILKQMAGWIGVNGEGVYGSRPWTKAMEGPSLLVSGHFKEDAVPWTTADFRFTTKGSTLYAFQMKYPENGQAFIRSLGLSSGNKVKAATVLGAKAGVTWHQYEDGLLVQFPEQKVCEFVPCVKVELA